MKTLYLRNVPDEVVEGLGLLAQRAGMSVGAFAVRELMYSARRAGNVALLDSSSDEDVTIEQVVEAVHAGRRHR